MSGCVLNRVNEVNMWKKSTRSSWLVIFIIGLAGIVHSALNDSAQYIFADDQVYTYKFSFYTPDWADSLEYYKELADEVYMPAKMLFFNQNGDTIQLDSIGIRYKGNSSYELSANSPKKPIKIRVDKYKSDQQFFGLERLNFSNVALDPSFMREKISYDIARAFMPAPRTAYANIYLEGALTGLYVQIEQIDKKFLKNYFEDNDGNLFKSSDNGATLVYRGQNQSGYEAEYDLKTNTDENNWFSFIDMIDKLNNTPDAELVGTLGSSLNLDNCIRHLAFTMVLSHFDSYTGTGRNFYLYDNPTSGQFSLIPWDLNLSFGGLSHNWNVISMDIVNISNLDQRPLNRRILENDSLRGIYFGYITGMIDGFASYDSISAAAEKIKAVIQESLIADTNKFYSDSNFLANIDSDIIFRNGPSTTVIPGIKSFIAARIESLSNQIAQYSPIRPDLKRPQNLIKSGLDARVGASAINVRYAISKAGPVRVRLITVQGKVIRTINEGTRQSGWYTCQVPKALLPSGYYAIAVSAQDGEGVTYAFVW